MTDTASPKATTAIFHDTPSADEPAPGASQPDLEVNTRLQSPPNFHDAQDEPNSDSELSALSSLEGDVEGPAAFDSSTTQNAPHNTHDANGDATSIGKADDAHPFKRRRLSTPSPGLAKRRAAPVSPPWKKIEADGPTSFLENGKRKSGRINRVPLESRPPGKKRITRGAMHTRVTEKPAATPRTNGHLRTGSAGKTLSSKTSAFPKPSASKKSSAVNTQPKRPYRRRSPSPSSQTTPRRTSARVRRSSRTDLSPNTINGGHDTRPTTRIRLRLKPATIPLIHPAQVNVGPGQTIARPKIGETFADYVEKAPNIEIAAGGWQDLAEEGSTYTFEQAEKDNEIIDRVQAEVQPGGLLSEERCSVFVPEPAEEPGRQWAQWDHLTKAMANFRKLMVMEHHRHRAAAKKLAEACRDDWIRRQPKTAEQVEAEARALWSVRYRLVVKAFSGTWENVRVEINRRRIEEWEAAEQKRVKAALNEAVNLSELKLQARRAHFDSEQPSDDEEDDDDESDLDDDDDEDIDEDDALSRDADQVSIGAGSEDQSNDDVENDGDDDNMSSSDDEDDAKSVVSDVALTQDQLREKYANVPELPPAEASSDESDTSRRPDYGEADDQDTSDESVDMDDDLGSSDMDTGDEDVASDDQDESEEKSTGMLGLLFGKSELNRLNAETSEKATNPSMEDVEMLDTSHTADGVAKLEINGVAAQTEDVCIDNANVVTADLPTNATELTPGDLTAKTQDDTTAEPTVAQMSSIDGRPASSNLGAVPPKDPYQANSPDAVAKIPEPLRPEDVEMQIAEAVEEVHQEMVSAEMSGKEISRTAPIPTVEVTNAGSSLQKSPDTEAITATPSRGRSQSPNTTDTKPSDVESTSLAKSGMSRSTSPQPGAPKTDVPFLLRGTLREYQHFGLDWLAGLYQNKTNGILADEMGLGKTIQTIALLAHLACHHEVWGPHLVIVPTSVMLNWEMEFKKWCPGFKVLSYYGSIEERKRKRQGWRSNEMWNICITSYQIVLQDQQVFKRRQWHYMILDEAHNIKNFKSKRWQTLLGFNTQARLLLTGTPLQNNLTELWSLLFFLMPSENGVGGFADLAEFQDWFHKPESQILESGRDQMDDEARAIISKLHKVLRPYLLRRLKADVEKQMPAKYEHVEFCRLSRRQRELYDGFLARTDTREALSSGNYISVINCLMQLRKVCNHPDLFVERPIMTSFRQSRSVIGDYEPTNRVVSANLLSTSPIASVSTAFLNLVPTQYEHLSADDCDRVFQLSAQHPLMELRHTQHTRAQAATVNLDPSTVESNIIYLDSVSRWSRFEELQHDVYINALRRQQMPVYGKRLRDFLTIGTSTRPRSQRPRVPAKIMAWFEEESHVLGSMVLDLDQRAASMKSTIAKFACITPTVITRDMDQFVLGSRGVSAFQEEDLRLSAPVRYAPFMPKESPLDPWHESRMRLSIQFPDKRLLQYDCGKLQKLDRLLRKLQSGGHRALIFTQMTKVLDILEQFLNIHGHKYLRLDGATKVEQRQILTDRFNNDTRILAFILSTRSGGLGINLTGADTVIFYDQDWNPAMDKQCQDRCHRIGQTRDVHIYRLISEHTIEANILRKASQKQMLDDVVIQEGSFTTDYFNKMSVTDVMRGVGEEAADDVVGDAMDRVLGGAETGGERAVGRVLEQAEDREDVDAAHVAEKEIQEDEADFEEKAPTTSASGISTARQGSPATRDGSAAPGVGRSKLGLYEQSADDVGEMESNAWGERVRNIDEYMLSTMATMLKGTPLELPRDKKKGKTKKGKDTRKR